ncbi:MAG TPA: alpha-amylase, partial [Clostridiaceae bacterium]|nr:alpha-amylase [Clostridiaceae bacterium]
PTKIGWVRRGDDEHTPLAVLISSADDDEERMFVGEAEAGQTYVDRSGKNEPITIDETGYGIFTVAPRSVTYWTRE